MAHEKLILKQLSKSGELLKVITCYAGQIAVFRGATPSSLTPFQRALAGIPGSERFVVELDHKQFVPDEHILIGFGEHFSGGGVTAKTAAALLLSCGVSESAVASALYSYGLEQIERTPLATLTACEERRLRILVAIYQPDKVLVLNEPFEPVSTQWRERLAEGLVAHVKAHNRIIVVPSLSYRPECWIDNEHIARIQVGESIQKTIGFGSTSHEMSDLVKKIRESGSPAGPQNQPGYSQQPAEPSEQAQIVTHSPSANYRKGWLAVGLVGILCVGFTVGISLSRNETDELSLPNAAEHSSSVAFASAPLQGVSSASSVPEITASAEVSSVAPTPHGPKLLLAAYSDDIRKSIVESFEGTGVDAAPSSVLGRAPRLSADEAARTKTDQPSSAPSTASELLSVLRSAETSTPQISEPTEPPTAGDATGDDLTALSPEQRREVIRQRFLEAIQRASAQQQNAENQ